jgi:hypothetical protein
MSIPQQSVKLDESAIRIFLFDEVYPARAAEEQAEKKKLSAFGMLAKFNPLNRPREDTVRLSRKEFRLEPFWHVSATRSVDYTTQLTYPVPVHNSYAQRIELDGKHYEVTRQGDKARIDLSVTEICHRKMTFDQFFDGLGRDIKPSVFNGYRTKYKFVDSEHIEHEQLVKPTVSQQAALLEANTNLNANTINAHHIESDTITVERLHLYWRPVFAFEFIWSSADKRGVIEVNGLTGEVSENGQWFKDKLRKVMTREMLLDAGSELAGALVPGGGVAVRIVGKLTE